MSGFITIYNTSQESVDRSLLYSLTQTLKFRGPDKQNVWLDDNIGMGHALFKTTFEAEYENQPATVDNKIWITCSARIDDRENLINKMGLKQSLDLSKTPDSELILHAYRKWDEDCLDHLLGDFAFVIWDKIQQKLFAARDHFGMRALYYSQKKNSIIFANSIYTMLQHPYITKELNDRAIGAFLLTDDHTWIDKAITVFSDINSLPPAHKFIYKNNRIVIKKYWDVPLNTPILRYKKETEYIEHFQDIFETSIKDRIRMHSIVISMSGGMDSTSVAATIHKMQKEQTIGPLKLQAVTGVYDRLIPCNERYYSNLVAKKLNIPIHYVAGDEYPMFLNFIPQTRPVHSTTNTFAMEIYKVISSYGRVVLTGDSADNVLTYSPSLLPFKEGNPLQILWDIYKLYKKYGHIPPLGTGISNLLKFNKTNQRLDNSIAYNFPYPLWLNKNFEKRAQLQKMNQEWLSYKLPNLHSRHPNLHTSIISPDWNKDDFFLKPDFTLSEKRDPYLDLRIINFVLSLPALPWLFKKHLLRSSMKGLLPNEIIERPKSGLYDLEEALLNEEQNNWIYNWKPSSFLSKYIVANKLQPLTRNQTIENYVNFRPLILDEWIKRTEKILTH